ncbi:MAG: hypothetical protein A2W23_07560 [Planctomycetes bacterium RBG_16_43_13]|nr:MAG: hypothetical protein A2W23_07560 [Planctomycetes bacterium RBG_16_43_13]
MNGYEKLSPAFVVVNGSTYEVHQINHDETGSRELTTAGPGLSEIEAHNEADRINFEYYL